MRLTWHVWAASTLALLYVLPHVWWMFGVSAGFPGDRDDFALAFTRTWFIVYNLLTTLLVVCGVIAVVSLGTRFRSPLLATIVKIGAFLLLLRGVLGVLSVASGLTAAHVSWMPEFLEQDLAFWPMLWESWFLVTGLVFLDSVRDSRATPAKHISSQT